MLSDQPPRLVLELEEQVELLRRLGSRSEAHRRAELGQFLTPWSVAQEMAHMPEPLPPSIRLVDPGAGTGSLTAAFVARCLLAKKKPKAITVDAYELDETIQDTLRLALKLCADACEQAGIHFTWKVLGGDFIATAAEAAKSKPRYNVAILNPPYKKLATRSLGRDHVRKLGVEVTNLYAAFVVAAVSLLEPDGQLVAITPRSFCNGAYFLPFRRFLFEQLDFRRIHVFDARNQAFRDDQVLQENVIVHATRGAQGSSVSVTTTPGGGGAVTARTVPAERVFDPVDPHLFIHIAAAEEDDSVADRIARLGSTLSDVGLTVSTGRVVDFRALDFLHAEPAEDCVPLLYPTHMVGGAIEWPKTGKKPNAIVDSEATASLLVPNGTYLLVRRFTAKEERRRVVAAVYDGSLPCDRIGIENHLNYFHDSGKPLDLGLANGLSLFLNSSLVDSYFRQFNGHTQINAGDLRRLRYPRADVLRNMGNKITSLPSQLGIDAVVDEVAP